MDSAKVKSKLEAITCLFAVSFGLLMQVYCSNVLAQTGPPGSLVGSLSDGLAEQDAQQNAYKLGYRRGRADQRRADRLPYITGKAPNADIYGDLKDSTGQQAPPESNAGQE